MNNNNDNINMSTILLNLQDQHTPTLLLPFEKKLILLTHFSLQCQSSNQACLRLRCVM